MSKRKEEKSKEKRKKIPRNIPMCKDNESLDSSDDNDNINYGAKKSFKKRNEYKKSTKMNNNCNSTIRKGDNYNKKDIGIANDERKSFNFKHRVKQERSDCKDRATENKKDGIRSNMAATNQQIKPRKAYFKMFDIILFKLGKGVSR